LIDEEVHEVDRKVYESFAKVLTSGWTNFLDNPGIIVVAMNTMHMGKREKGAISNEQKYKSLTGRWFGVKQEKLVEKVQVIERGSIVSFDESREMWFIVTALFRESGSKWYMAALGDDPSWPIDTSKAKTYRLEVSAVQIKMEENGTKLVQMKDYETLVDGSNVHESFKLIKDITTIKRHLFKVDIF